MPVNLEQLGFICLVILLVNAHIIAPILGLVLGPFPSIYMPIVKSLKTFQRVTLIFFLFLIFLLILKQEFLVKFFMLSLVAALLTYKFVYKEDVPSVESQSENEMSKKEKIGTIIITFFVLCMIGSGITLLINSFQ